MIMIKNREPTEIVDSFKMISIVFAFSQTKQITASRSKTERTEFKFR